MRFSREANLIRDPLNGNLVLLKAEKETELLVDSIFIGITDVNAA